MGVIYFMAQIILALIVIAIGASSISKSSRRLDIEARRQERKMKDGFDKRQHWDETRRRRDKIERELGTCHICHRPETRDQEKRFGICRKCAESQSL